MARSMKVDRPSSLGRLVGAKRTEGNGVETEALSHVGWVRGLQGANKAPRCRARCRSGLSCRGPAMKNGRCRMHGGASPGAPRGDRNGRYRHGRYTTTNKAMMAEVRQVVRALRALWES